MYHNTSFFLNNATERSVDFQPNVISAYKILTDESYYHICDESEKTVYGENAICLIRCTAGEGVIYLNSGKINLCANDYVLLKFSDIVKYKSLTHIWGYRWVNFTLNDLKSVTLSRVSTVPYSENEDLIFDRLLLFGINSDMQGYINLLFCDYYYNITMMNEIKSITENRLNRRRQIDDICAFIEQKVFSRITVGEVSAFFYLSPRRLHQIFSSELNISPKQYILKKKMEEGYRLLVQTSMPVNKISELLCFSSQYHFTNEFKRFFNQTPTQVRNLENSA